MKEGEHLTEIGLLKIVALKSLFKKGLSFKLSNAFPNAYLIVNQFKINYIPELELMNLI
jgi:hypothetical protein